MNNEFDQKNFGQNVSSDFSRNPHYGNACTLHLEYTPKLTRIIAEILIAGKFFKKRIELKNIRE